ncbi:DUF1624 domain-containing protein [Undibacterium sp. CY7W]|uniref:DUF1624 domain-containing protein n=1 Tax=Undibacterium rugosum TaxID=2762291 RepID=A0A923I2J2_9BURK|nr:heparan-alpha-glucosaminide N-acetyltransferase domain-containing protein [Undibacterium rugosum]MBC3936511.1 DUF1624 domain-containing protein [Undibacterium rugosum]
MTQQSVRYSSIDALRGWTVAGMLLVNNAGDWNHVLPWLEHAQWNGCTPADLIFPFFLFIVGLSLELAFAPQLAKGVMPEALRSQALRRGLRMLLLGVALHVFACLTIDGRAFRLMGVLQRIGIVFVLAAFIMLYLRTQSSRWIALLALMALHSLLLLSGGSLLPHANLSDRIDSVLLGPLAYQYDALTHMAQEPEGILSTLGALSSVLFGIQAGSLLRNRQTPQLVWLALACLCAGLISGLELPWNKQMWTASFVLWTSGWAMALLLLVHQLIDVRGYPAIGRSFGINAIAAYAGSWIATCLLAYTGAGDWIYLHWFAPNLPALIGEAWSSAAFAVAFTAVFAALTHAMARKNWRIVI